jgi:valyl-tRNA synthetase
VHPDDPRYAHLRGAHVWRPFPRAQIPIIFDTAVDKEFGSGALKVTPAHDRVDFEIGQRHQLPIIEVIDASGKLNEFAGEEFKGMERFKARKVAAEKLKELGLLVKEEPYENNVGFSERADVPIEPRLSEQWFLKYPRIPEAKAAVRDGHIKFWPDHWSKVYINWLDKIQDWCISRQVWWGHRIPVWYKKGADRNDPQNRHVSVDGPADPQNWEQDEDSLDTWASSWLWPFATMGWPEPDAKQAAELKFWYPTSDLVTGPDIIFFWVARMIIAGLEFMPAESERKQAVLPNEVIEKCIPFKNVYFTGIIRDKQGRKMSKTLGNSPDPIDLIAKYGADGLRYGTMDSAPHGSDVLFDEADVALGRNFCNKLWNAARFRQMQGPTDANNTLESILIRLRPAYADSHDQAIVESLCKTLDALKQNLADYLFQGATQNLYEFFWGNYCDWYLEVIKARLDDLNVKPHILAVQDLCMRQFLLLLHPFMPFITEELWHGLGYGSDGSFIQNSNPGDGCALRQTLAMQSWPNDQNALHEVEGLQDLVTEGLALKPQFNMAANRQAEFTFIPNSENRKNWVESNKSVLMRLLGAKSIAILPINSPIPEGMANEHAIIGIICLNVVGAVDKAAESAKLNKELEQLDKVIASSEARLANEAFTSKAPAAVIDGARKQLAENQVKREELRRLLAALK